MLSSGCSNMLKNDYYPPQVNYPANWSADKSAGTITPFSWRDFHDPQLDKLLRQVTVNNNDFAAAVLRVYHARLEAKRAGINTMPRLNAALNSGKGKMLAHSYPWSESSTAKLSTSYEIDLWGKLALQRDSAQWASQATEADLQAARATLLSDASNNYWRIAFINQQIDALQHSLSYARETLRLARAHYRAGKTSSLDVVDAEQNLQTQKGRLVVLQHDRLQALNEQSLLLGAPPGSPVTELSRLPDIPLPQIKADIPASVLRQRPDINAKEWHLRQALADVDLSRTGYYPTLSLTGSLGTTSSMLLAFLQNPVSSVGMNLSLPFLEWRQMDMDIRIARNDYEQRVLEFKQALYKAMTGAWILAGNIRHFGYSWEAVGAYNAGYANTPVKKTLRQKYIKKVVPHYQKLKNINAKG